MPYSSNDLIRYQQLYEQEKQRIDREEAAADADKARRNYELQLNSAKSAARIEKLKSDEILRIQKLSNDEYLAELKALAEQEKEILNNLKREVSNVYSEIAKFADENIQSVIDSQQKLEDKLSSYGSKFAHYTVRNGGENGEDLSFYLLNDFAQTNRTLEAYYNAVTAVKDRIKSSGFDPYVSSNFLSAMSEMSISEGTTFANLLSSASDSQFNQYIWGWVQNLELSKKLSSEIYSDDFNRSVDATMSYMKSELEKIGFEIPDNFTLSGTISAENFGQAFVDTLDKKLEEIRDMISGFNASLSVSAAVSSSPEGSAAASNVTYNQSFNVGSSKDSTFDQISAWKNALLQARLRGQ